MFSSIFRGSSPHQSVQRALPSDRMLLGLQARLPLALKNAQVNARRERIDGDFIGRVAERAAALRAIDGLPAEFHASIGRMERFAKTACEDIAFSTYFGPVLYRHLDSKGKPLVHPEPIGAADLQASALFSREVVLSMPTVEMVQQHQAAGYEAGLISGDFYLAQERYRTITLMVDAAPAGTPMAQVVRQAAQLQAMCEEHERGPDAMAEEGECDCVPVLALEDPRHFDALGADWVAVLMKDGQIVADTLGLIEARMLRLNRTQDVVNWAVLRTRARLREAEAAGQ